MYLSSLALIRKVNWKLFSTGPEIEWICWRLRNPFSQILFENNEFYLFCNTNTDFKKHSTIRGKVQNKSQQKYLVFKFNLFAKIEWKSRNKVFTLKRESENHSRIQRNPSMRGIKTDRRVMWVKEAHNSEWPVQTSHPLLL